MRTTIAAAAVVVLLAGCGSGSRDKPPPSAALRQAVAEIHRYCTLGNEEEPALGRRVDALVALYGRYDPDATVDPDLRVNENSMREVVQYTAIYIENTCSGQLASYLRRHTIQP